MSRLEKLAIRGIRSFCPLTEIKIELFRPLTLIQGHNGSGKTTIIECLKMATCGSLPPLSTNGKTFINDPKILSSNETKASIKLKFLTPKDKEVIVVRNFQLSIKAKKYEFKRLEQVLKSYNQNGDLVTINSTCMDIDKQIPLLMHASKAIIENVIFCHQEEINWPFSEAGNLKKVFDEIFNTAKYTKALEDLKDTNKAFQTKSKELKIKIELIQKDYEQFNRITHQINQADKKVVELNTIVSDLKDAYEKSTIDLDQILTLEKNFKEYENGINLAKAKKAEKLNQVSTIKNDPMFQDYTRDDVTFQAYCNNYHTLLQNDSIPQTDKEKLNHIEALTTELKKYNEQLNQLDANIISKQQMYNNFLRNKEEMIKSLSLIEDMENKITQDCSIENALIKLKEKEVEIVNRTKIIEDKRKEFEAKLSEKINDTEVNKHIYESKCKEIDLLQTKKNSLMQMKSNLMNNSSRINDITQLVKGKKNQIEILNFNIKQSESLKDSIENNNSTMTIRLQSIKQYDTSLNSNIVAFHLDKIKELCDSYYANEKSLIIISQQINNTFKSYFVIDKKSLTKFIDDIIMFIKGKKEEIVEEKQKIREHNLILKMEIDQTQISITTISNEITDLVNKKQSLFQEIKSLYLKLNIPIKDNTDDLGTILSIKAQYENTILKEEETYNALVFEIKYLKEYLNQLSVTSQCNLCDNILNNDKSKIITNNKHAEIKALQIQSETLNSKLKEDKNILNEIRQSDSNVAVLKRIIDEINIKTNIKKEFEFKLIDQMNKRKIFENSSKEKSIMLTSMNSFLEGETTDDIVKLRAKIGVIDNNIMTISKILAYPNEIIESHNIEEIQKKTNSIRLTIQEILSIENTLTENEAKIIQINQSLSSDFQKLNIISKEMRDLEDEKNNLLKVSDEKEMAVQLDDLTNEINHRETEKTVLLSELSKINELKNVLCQKKEQFDALYYEKIAKYKSIMDKIANWKMKNEYIKIDFNRLIEANDMQMNNEQGTDTIFLSIIESLNQHKQQILTQKQLIDNELHKCSEEANLSEVETKQRQLRENMFKNNQMLYKIKGELIELDEYITNHEKKLQAGARLVFAKDLLVKKNHENLSNYNKNLGKLEELKSYLSRLSTEIKHDNYKEIDKRYLNLKSEYVLSQETSKQIENYYESLDQSLLKYHGKRMEEINKLINYYWAMTYKGNDIKWIEIRSDFEKLGRSRNYNYRIVFGTKGEQELDMRGRCSAGQKVLASIIIRLALAETFCNNCGILCLDEPTTNLDEEHSRALARSLREIIQSRADDQNFQLIIITHDSTFVDLIGTDFCDSFWQVAKNENNFSTITLKPVSSLFNH